MTSDVMPAPYEKPENDAKMNRRAILKGAAAAAVTTLAASKSLEKWISRNAQTWTYL